MSTERDSNGRFSAGASGNPKGRVNGARTLAAAVRDKWPAERIVDLATQLAASEDESIRMRALEWLADRGHGRVPTTIDATIAQGPSQLDAERLLARLSTDALRELVAASAELDTELEGGPANLPVLELRPPRIADPMVSVDESPVGHQRSTAPESSDA